MSVSSELSPTQIMSKIKNVTSKILRKEYNVLSKMPALWTRGFLVSTASVNPELIQKYVNHQKTSDRK